MHLAVSIIRHHPTHNWNMQCINPLNAKLNPIRHLLALFGAHHIFHVSRIRVNSRSLQPPSQPGDRYHPSRTDYQMGNQCRIINNSHSPCLKTATVNWSITTDRTVHNNRPDRVMLAIPSKKHTCTYSVYQFLTVTTPTAPSASEKLHIQTQKKN